MIKMVASDLDGTILLNGAQEIPKELFSFDSWAQGAGNSFVAASGRQYSNMKRLFAPVLSDMAFICENGAMAIQNEEILYQDAFEPSLVKEIVEAVYERENSEFSYSTKDYYYLRPKTRHYLELMTETIKTDCRLIQDFDEFTEPLHEAGSL